MISRTGVESDVEEVGVSEPSSLRGNFARMMLLSKLGTSRRPVGTFNYGDQDSGLGLKAWRKTSVAAASRACVSAVAIPADRFSENRVANVVVVGGGEKDRGRSRRFDDGCADDGTAMGHSSGMQKRRNSENFILQ